MSYGRKRRHRYRRVFRRYRRRSRGFGKRFKRRRGTRETRYKARTGQIVPDTFYVKMRWKWFKAGGAATTAPVYESFYINDPYNPAVTTGDTSAFGWTEYAALYQQFVCFGSKINVEFTNQSNAQAYCVVVPSVTSLAITAPSTTQEFQDQTNAKSCVLAQTTAGYRNVKRIKYYMPINKIFGFPKIRTKVDSSFYGTNGSSPTTLGYWHVGYWCVDGTTSTTVNCTISITYYVKWSVRVKFTS